MGERAVSDINNIVVVGRCGKDPQFKETQGADLCTFSIATTRVYKRNETKEEETTWHNIVCWGRIAGVARDYVNKGDRVGVVGRYQQNHWTTDEGDKRVTPQVVCQELMLIGRTQASGGAPKAARQAPAREPATATADGDFNDDIPW